MQERWRLRQSGRSSDSNLAWAAATCPWRHPRHIIYVAGALLLLEAFSGGWEAIDIAWRSMHSDFGLQFATGATTPLTTPWANAPGTLEVTATSTVAPWVYVPMSMDMRSLWLSRIALAQQARDMAQRTLVVYSGPTHPAGYGVRHAQYHRNLHWFLLHGLRDASSSVDTVVVTTREANVSASLQQMGGVRWVLRQNICYELESYRVGLSSIAANASHVYDTFVFLNCGLLGPFLPTRVSKSGTHWSRFFTSRLTEDVKMVGLTISCGTISKRDERYPHVQSMLYAIDRKGLELVREALRHADIAFPKPGDQLKIWQDSFVESASVSRQRFYCPNFVETSLSLLGFEEFIRKYEIGMSRFVMESGFGIAAINAWQTHRDFRREKEWDERKCRDFWLPHQYVNGTDIGGFDSIFIKTTRPGFEHCDPEAIMKAMPDLTTAVPR